MSKGEDANLNRKKYLAALQIRVRKYANKLSLLLFLIHIGNFTLYNLFYSLRCYFKYSWNQIYHHDLHHYFIYIRINVMIIVR